MPKNPGSPSDYPSMPSVERLCAEIRGALSSSANEHELSELIEQNLSKLRVIYRNNRSQFSEATIIFLSGARAVSEDLREFIDTIQDKDWVRTRDDAQELASRFAELAERLKAHLVSKRCVKEARELSQRTRSLRAASEIEGNAERHRTIAHLELRAPTCPKCKTKMTVRESASGLFWGCRRFPGCFGKLRLSTEDAESLASDR